jgi:rhamnosyltransferase subunit B
MHAILATVGTDGDFYPYLRLGKRLRARGHRVTLAANEPHGSLAADHGFDFHPLVSEEQTRKRLTDPNFWHPVKGPLLASEWGVGFLQPQYELLERLAAPEDSVLVAAPLIFAARLVHEKLSRPLASVLLQPWGIPSIDAPPVMPGGFTLPRWSPRFVGKLYWGLIDKIVDRRLGRPVNRVRERLGLPAVRNVARYAFSPDLVLGMFPDWYGEPQADWPGQTRLPGFPLEETGSDSRLSPDTAAFCRSGKPPVAFTFGTGMLHARRQIEAAIDACRRLELPGVLLTPHEEQLPTPLPGFVHHCRFAPFAELFPLCSAVVHHGGMGTLAQALVAGLPQLVLPLAHDQPDNAARLERLGVGAKLGPRQGGERVARALAALSRPEIRARCRELATRLVDHDSLAIASDWLEELSSRSAARSRARSGR